MLHNCKGLLVLLSGMPQQDSIPEGPVVPHLGCMNRNCCSGHVLVLGFTVGAPTTSITAAVGLCCSTRPSEGNMLVTTCNNMKHAVTVCGFLFQQCIEIQMVHKFPLFPTFNTIITITAKQQRPGWAKTIFEGISQQTLPLIIRHNKL
jgi:hypothetical protein